MGSRFFVRRGGQAILTILFVLVLNFILFRSLPGSPERILLRNPRISAAALEAQRERWGSTTRSCPSPSSATRAASGSRTSRPR